MRSRSGSRRARALTTSASGATDGAELFGGPGEDELEGGAGDDVLDGGGNADVLDGGNGIDTVTYGYARSVSSSRCPMVPPTAG